jgi:hypothetical protein
MGPVKSDNHPWHFHTHFFLYFCNDPGVKGPLTPSVFQRLKEGLKILSEVIAGTNPGLLTPRPFLFS